MSLKVKLAHLKGLLFENRNVKQTILKNTFWLTFGNLLGRVIKAGLIIYAARVLGTAGYGTFSYVVGLAGFFTIFADIGLTGIMTRETAKNPGLVKNYVSTALFIKLILVVLSIALVLFGAPKLTKIPEALPLLPIAALLLMFDTLRDFSFSITRAFERMEVEAGVNVFTNIAITVLGVLAILWRGSAKSLMIGYALGSGAGMVASFWVLRGVFGRIWRHFDKGLVKKLLSEAWPFAFLGLLGGIMLNTDTIMIGWFKSADMVGIYSAAQRPIQLIYIIPSILAASFFPIFSKLAKNDNEKFRLIFEKSIAIVLGAAVPLTFGGIILANQIVNLLFGQPFLAATPVLQILLLTVILTFPGTLIGNAVFAYGEQKSFIRSLTFGAFGNVLFNLLLIPSFGAVGSAVATVVAQFLSNTSNWLKLKQVNNFRIAPHIKKIIFATVIMVIFTFGLKWIGLNVILNILLSMSIYIFTLYKIREPLLDKNFILSIFR